MSEQEPASFLPDNVRETLKRKSSRDPNSRFPTKLHRLLTYSAEFPNLQDRIGLAWTSDEEFKMNKSTLSAVMGIKLNTLNVNLRDLRFLQVERDKDSWTRWRCTGFTRSSSGVEAEGEFARHLTSEAALVGRAPTLPFELGKIGQAQRDAFSIESQRLWVDLVQCSTTCAVQMPLFLERAAHEFRYIEQPIENAKEVIEAIIIPTITNSKLTFADLCRFLAMFGPPKTVMLKIASLLTCSNQSGKWLTFEFDRVVPHTPPYACFDESMPNCLVVRHGDNTIDKVYNDPNVEAGDGSSYLFDEHGKVYGAWNEYFQFHPVKSVSSYGMYQFA
jgi:hypothetical protein